MTAAATKATFSDFRIVKGRKVAQLVFEVPLEGADAALAALGGLPQPATERWCAIARLTEEAARKPDARERYAQMSEGEQAVTRATLLCKDLVFQNWIIPNGSNTYVEVDNPMDYIPAVAAVHLRKKLGIKSRAELATNAEALARFLALEARFKSERAFGPHATR